MLCFGILCSLFLVWKKGIESKKYNLISNKNIGSINYAIWATGVAGAVFLCAIGATIDSGLYDQ